MLRVSGLMEGVKGNKGGGFLCPFSRNREDVFEKEKDLDELLLVRFAQF